MNECVTDDRMETPELTQWAILRELIARNRITIRYEQQDLTPLNGGKVLSANCELTIRDFPDHWLYATTDGENPARLIVAKDYSLFSILPPRGRADDVWKRGVNLLLRTAFECLFPYDGIVSLHSACVDCGGRAVAFTGPSGIGKSTRARAWIDALGAEFLSGDRPAVRLNGNHAIACGVPWDGKEQIFRDAQLPLAAIFEVRRAPFRAMRRLSASQAHKALMKQCFIPMWDNRSSVAAMSVMRRLADAVPVYRLFCGPDADAAIWTCDALSRRGMQEEIGEDMIDMTVKEGYVLRNVVGEHIVMPVGDAINRFEGVLVLNDVSAFLWENMQAPICKEDLLALLLAEFDVDEALGRKDLDMFLDKLREQNLLEEESPKARSGIY